MTYATAFLGRHFRVTQRKSLEIQTCSFTKGSPVQLNRRETPKSHRVFYLIELKELQSFRLMPCMKSDPRLNWHFESSSRYSGLSRCVPSSSHRLPRSSRRELGLFVSSSTSSSRRLPRSSRRRRVRLVDSPDRLVVIRLVATEFVSSTRETDSSRITPLRLVKCRVRLVELWDRLVVS